MNFASYTSSEYFPIFLTFYDSIKKNKNLNLYVLCLDDDVKSLIKKTRLPGLARRRNRSMACNPACLSSSDEAAIAVD